MLANRQSVGIGIGIEIEKPPRSDLARVPNTASIPKMTLWEEEGLHLCMAQPLGITPRPRTKLQCRSSLYSTQPGAAVRILCSMLRRSHSLILLGIKYNPPGRTLTTMGGRRKELHILEQGPQWASQTWRVTSSRQRFQKFSNPTRHRTRHISWATKENSDQREIVEEREWTWLLT